MNSNKNVVIFMQGAPGSGKSTKARELAAEYPDKKFVIVNKDSIRNMTAKEYSKDLEDLVGYTQLAFITRALNTGFSVIIDNTNFNKSTVEYIVDAIWNLCGTNNIASECGMNNISMYYYKMDTNLKECLRRNALRTGIARVPDNVVNKFYDKPYDIFPSEVKNFRELESND